MACTIDLEMQLEVGLKDKAEDLETLEDLIMEHGSDLLEQSTGEEDSADSEVMVDDTTGSCEVAMLELHDADGETIFVEWEIHRDEEAETVVALLQGNDVLHLDVLSMEENSYEFPRPEEAGEYHIYVGSGEDPNNPDCFSMPSIEIHEMDVDPDIDPDSNSATNSCQVFDNVESLPSVHPGESLFIEWDIDMFASEDI